MKKAILFDMRSLFVIIFFCTNLIACQQNDREENSDKINILSPEELVIADKKEILRLQNKFDNPNSDHYIKNVDGYHYVYASIFAPYGGFNGPIPVQDSIMASIWSGEPFFWYHANIETVVLDSTHQNFFILMLELAETSDSFPQGFKKLEIELNSKFHSIDLDLKDVWTNRLDTTMDVYNTNINIKLDRNDLDFLRDNLNDASYISFYLDSAPKKSWKLNEEYILDLLDFIDYYSLMQKYSLWIPNY